ncbi:MAG: hypothetical protein ABIO46_16185, partial [Chitinophagales bacterium]
MTKKFTLLAAAVSFSVMAFAQAPKFSTQFHAVKSTPAIENKMLKINTFRYTGMEPNLATGNTSSNANVGATSTTREITHTIIGTTYYDLQTNSSVCNRLVNNTDGTVQATWTHSPDAVSGFPNRGTGYVAKIDGVWGPPPAARIESERTGWPNIVRTGNGGEFVIAHNTVVS